MIDESINSFLKKSIGTFQRHERIEGDASVRKYYRVFCDEKSFILCHDPHLEKTRSGDSFFFTVYGLLKDRVPVPEILATDETKGFVLLCDAGDGLLEYRMPAMTETEAREVYCSIIDLLINIQKIRGAGVPFKLSFDMEKLMYEFDFFIEHFLTGYCGTVLSGDDIDLLRKEFWSISEVLYRPEYFVLNHRDFHSRNLIVKDDTIYVIDYQDARMGLPQYDAVSLLRDSYVRLSDSSFACLKQYYYHVSTEHGVLRMSPDEYAYFFDIMAFQRNVKALGTFGYQVSALQNRRYEPNIATTLAYLADYAAARDELKTAFDIITDIVQSVGDRA